MISQDILELLFWWHHINFPFNVQEGSEYNLYWEILSKLIKPRISTWAQTSWGSEVWMVLYSFSYSMIWTIHFFWSEKWRNWLYYAKLCTTFNNLQISSLKKIFSLGEAECGSQSTVLRSYSWVSAQRSLMKVLRGPYVMLRIKLRTALRREDALQTAIPPYLFSSTIYI